MNQSGIKPPRAALAFFRWFCHPEIREDIEGDIIERFNERIKTEGINRSKILFIKDVITLIRPGIIKRFDILQTDFMKRAKWIRVVFANLMVAVFILLPFLPGPPNKISMVLGSLGQSAGFFGLVLVPLGIFCLISGHVPKWLFIIIAVLISLISLLTAFLIFGVYGISAGIIATAIIAAGLLFFLKWIHSGSNSNYSKASIYLFTIPLVALFMRLYVTTPMSNYSRNFAIERSERLISAIEQFKDAEGRYPESVNELHSNIPSPFIMGIEKFRYKKYNDRYYLSFTQWPNGGELEEIVLFGKQDPTKKYISREEYDYSNDLHRVMGAMASYDTRYDYWRYYLCD